MGSTDNRNQIRLQPEQLNRLYKRHFQGAFVRIGASLFMWLYALFSYVYGTYGTDNIVGVSATVAYLILMNFPTLWILKKIADRRLYEYFSLLINLLEIIGYTAIIHFLGGINGLYISPLYAALIVYVGTVGSPRLPFIIASLCMLLLGSLVAVEFFGFLPNRDPFSRQPMPGIDQFVILTGNICLLYVVAFISSYTGSHRIKNKERLRLKNIELEKSHTALTLGADELNKKNVELQAAIGKALESDRMKSEFLANMSHELRTPLNHVIGFTELVLDKNFGDLNETQEEYLTDVHQSSNHLLSLINDILDISKVEAGKIELELSDVLIRNLLENSLTMVKEKAMKHRIQLSLDMDSVPEIIRADERKLKQIMYNLISNAVKFVPDGGAVNVTAQRVFFTDQTDVRHPGTNDVQPLEHRNGTSEVSAMEPEGCIKFTVSDTGIGIEPENHDRIFNPFEQVDGSSNRRHQGTGLGLSLTKSFIDLHGGKIWVESKGNGKGSTFCFIIPS